MQTLTLLASVLALLIVSTQALYQDQAGVIDW